MKSRVARPVVFLHWSKQEGHGFLDKGMAMPGAESDQVNEGAGQGELTKAVMVTRGRD